MNDLREIWGKRFFHYMREIQKYAQFIFTGHLAIVLVFAIGATGYAYSEWLKEVPTDFPAAILVALILSATLVFSSPTTLLKPADIIFFLPLEGHLGSYMKRALRWSFVAQLPLPIIIYIVSLPLLSATNTASTAVLLWLAVFIIALKWIFVEIEFSIHFAKAGGGILQDRVLRFVFSATFIYLWLTPYLYLILLPAIGVAIYMSYVQKLKGKKPFPYEHFISLEQNRMMRFYRFANYFTDVPHLKGAIKPRRWLGFLMKPPIFGKKNSQSFLVKRTFIRTDDTFWLWIRLTLLAMGGAYFLSIPIAVMIFVGALAFAATIQLIFALRASDEFRMDMLFPEEQSIRAQAIVGLVRKVQWLQAVLVLLISLVAFKFSLVVLMNFIIIIVISELTIRSTMAKA